MAFKPRRFINLVLISAALLALTFHHAVGQPSIDTLGMRAQTYFLSHDLLKGRATGTEGARLAAAYIKSECRRIGLVPAGSTYGQPVPLERTTILPGTRLIATRLSRPLTFIYPDDFIPNLGTRATFSSFRGPAVYVGAASELDSERLRGLQLDGAVAVVLGPRVTRDGFDLLRERGAVAVVHILPEQGAYDAYVASRGTARLYHRDPSIVSSFLPSLPSVLAGPRLSAALVVGAVRGSEVVAGPLGVEVAVDLAKDSSPVEAENIVCQLPGTGEGAGDTAVVFTAHYDHLGVASKPDTAGDSIYNGFADNAAGVAMLLGIARAAALEAQTPPRHSWLFLFLDGEERGLLGSDYYVARPFWPLEKTRAVINIDGGAPAGRLESFRLAGVDSTGLGAIAIGIAQERGWEVTTSPPSPNSDYYPFVREGVPGVFVIPGPGAYEGLSSDSSDALKHRWRYYHDPQDEWTADFPFGGLQRYAEYAYFIAQRLDAADK